MKSSSWTSSSTQEHLTAALKSGNGHLATTGSQGCETDERREGKREIYKFRAYKTYTLSPKSYNGCLMPLFHQKGAGAWKQLFFLLIES